MNLTYFIGPKVYGHTYISRREHRILRDVLSTDCNVVFTCKFANRSLHAKYDNEIADALKTARTDISPGAKLRVKQILKTLPRLKSESDALKHFFDRSWNLLKPLSAWCFLALVSQNDCFAWFLWKCCIGQLGRMRFLETDSFKVLWSK